jgi:hypothetical protein
MRDVSSADRLPMAATSTAGGMMRRDEHRPGPIASNWRVAWRCLCPFVRPWTLVLLALIVGHLIPLTWLTSGPSFCPFKVATGLPCPGCGLTRSSVALLQGDLVMSLYYHPLGVAILVGAVAVGLVDFLAWRRGRRPGAAPLPPSWIMERIFATPAPWIAIAALAIVWVVRLPLYLLGTWTF